MIEMDERMTGRLRPKSIEGAVLIVLLAFLGSGLLAGCSAGHAATLTAVPGAAATMAPTAGEGPGMMAMMSAADAAALWSARPAFVRADGRVQEAYAFALEAGGALQYMPCYCGCAAMDHRSNLDCFLRRDGGIGATAFEEHASYCDVCVQTALMAKRMLAAGSSLGEIRAAVDATFGAGGAPGTATELPPS
jgi:hypothetical protein